MVLNGASKKYRILSSVYSGDKGSFAEFAILSYNLPPKSRRNFHTAQINPLRILRPVPVPSPGIFASSTLCGWLQCIISQFPLSMVEVNVKIHLLKCSTIALFHSFFSGEESDMILQNIKSSKIPERREEQKTNFRSEMGKQVGDLGAITKVWGEPSRKVWFFTLETLGYGLLRSVHTFVGHFWYQKISTFSNSYGLTRLYGRARDTLK